MVPKTYDVKIGNACLVTARLRETADKIAKVLRETQGDLIDVEGLAVHVTESDRLPPTPRTELPPAEPAKTWSFPFIGEATDDEAEED